MSSSLRRGTVAATVLALSVAPLTACAAGNDAQTLQVKPDSAATSQGDIKAQAVNVIITEGGEGPAAVNARLFNNSDRPQTLEAIRLSGVGKAELSPEAGKKSLTVPAHGVLALGGKGNASAAIDSSRAAKLTAGDAQRVTFVLSSTGGVSLRAMVVTTDQDDFAKFGPSEKPTPSAPATGTPSPRPSAPTGTATPTEGGEATATAPGAGAEEPGAATDGGSHAGH